MGNPYPAVFTDQNDEGRVVGAVTFTDSNNQPGGGSQPEWLPSQTLYANRYQTIDPTQNGPGFDVADGGTFKLSYGAEQTAAIQWNASAADVLAALVLLPTLTGKITLDTDDHTGSGAGAGPLPTAKVSFVLADALEPQAAITLSDNSLTNGGNPIDPWPIGVTQGYLLWDAFTPAVDDVIEDFLVQVLTANDGVPGTGPQEVYLTDGTLSNIINDNLPTYWASPQAGTVDLNRDADDFTNFSGLSAAGNATTPSDSFAGDLVAATVPVSLPSRCLHSVPLSWYSRVGSGAPTPNGVYVVTAKVGRIAP